MKWSSTGCIYLNRSVHTGVRGIILILAFLLCFVLSLWALLCNSDYNFSCVVNDVNHLWGIFCGMIWQFSHWTLDPKWTKDQHNSGKFWISCTKVSTPWAGFGQLYPKITTFLFVEYFKHVLSSWSSEEVVVFHYSTSLLPLLQGLFSKGKQQMERI